VCVCVCDENAKKARAPQTRRDPRAGHPRYSRPGQPRFPDVEHFYHHTTEDKVCRHVAGHVSLMRIDVRSVLIKVPGLPAQGPYADKPPSPPPYPALDAAKGCNLEADRSPYDVAAQSEGEATKGSEGLSTPPRRVSSAPATLSQGVQTSPTREDHPQEVSDQGTQTSPPNRQGLRCLTQTPEMRVPYDEGPPSPRRDVGVSTPIVQCS